jgi:3-deoxy-D-arabino-heptulosonate 7-phosphate (DAHP) synthase class II|tara:strand:- start:2432 stop:2566 length:135 start_codon:yes stop_codon:yes gene_type:complete
VDREQAIAVLETIKENVNVCCAITMEPDEVLDLCDKLALYIKNN